MCAVGAEAARPALLINKPAKLDWSKYQQAVYNFVDNSKGNALVQAVAGSGKTTTLVNALTYTYDTESVIVLAFSKPVVMELGRRVPQGVEVATSHALGLRDIRKLCGNVAVKKDRVIAFLKKALPGYKELGDLARTISLAKNTAATSRDEICELMAQVGVDFGAPPSNTRAVEARERELASVIIDTLKQCQKLDGFVDFDDMIWLPTVHNMPPAFRYDRVLVDEAQDLNPLQLRQVKKIVHKQGHALVFGDQHQAIFGFRGADSNAMSDLRTAFKATELPLSVCYRCGTRIVAEAKKIVPHIESPPGQHEGMVFDDVETTMIVKSQPGDLIVSRYNSPMIRLCYKLLLAGKSAHIMGNNVGRTIGKLVKRLDPEDIGDLRRKIIEWRDAEIDRSRQHPIMRTDTIRDKAMCILALCDSVGSLSELQTRIDKLFSDTVRQGSVVLSSTHRAKGMERDNVWVLHDTYPYTWANGHGDNDEERNLYYVAITRAVNKLHIVHLDRPFRELDIK